MISEYREYYWSENPTHTLRLHNCKYCDIQILATEQLCDTCRILCVDADTLHKQYNLWKRYIYNPWLKRFRMSQLSEADC